MFEQLKIEGRCIDSLSRRSSDWYVSPSRSEESDPGLHGSPSPLQGLQLTLTPALSTAADGYEVPLRFVDDFSIHAYPEVGTEQVSLDDVRSSTASLRGYLIPTADSQEQGTRLQGLAALRLPLPTAFAYLFCP